VLGDAQNGGLPGVMLRDVAPAPAEPNLLDQFADPGLLPPATAQRAGSKMLRSAASIGSRLTNWENKVDALVGQRRTGRPPGR
jgi:hypothetical protein